MITRLLFALAFALFLAETADARGTSSSIGVAMMQFTGEKEKSLLGTYGFAGEFNASNSNGAFRITYGADFQYAKAQSYIAQVARNATYYGTDFKLGFEIMPVPKSTIRPFIGAQGMIGLKSLSFDQPQTTLPRESTSASYGYRATVGVEIEAFESSAIRISASYNQIKAQKLADQKDYDLGSLSGFIGLAF
jgi:hypothetical protein